MKAVDSKKAQGKRVPEMQRVVTRDRHAVRGQRLFGKATSAPSKGKASIAQFALLRRPIITEKAAGMSSDRNRVAFRVDPEASKTDIRLAVEAVYGVKVKAVRTVSVMGKFKRAGSSMGRRASFKKAYVTLRDGETIDVVEGL